MQKAALARALKLVAPALHNRDFIPVLTHVCFNGDSLFAFDDKTAVVVFEETDIRCAVRGRVLIEMVENADEDLELSFEDNHLVLTDGSSSINLPALSDETFLFQMPDLDSTEVSITGELEAMQSFLECLELASATSNEESLRPELVGVTVQAQGKDGLTLYSTDNISCTRVVALSPTVEGSGVVIIPKSSCQLLGKTFRDLKEGLANCGIYFLKGAVLATFTTSEGADVWVVCKTVAAKPADYETILESNLEEDEYGDLPESLEKALSRASVMFKDDYARSVQIIPTDEGLQLFCSGDYGELNVLVESEVAPVDTVTINPDLVRRMMPQCQSLMFCKSAMAMVSHTDDYDLTYLVAYKKG